MVCFRGSGSDAEYVEWMDPSFLNSVVLFVVFSAIFFYVLFGVVKAAVREGIEQAWQRREDQANS